MSCIKDDETWHRQFQSTPLIIHILHTLTHSYIYIYEKGLSGIFASARREEKELKKIILYLKGMHNLHHLQTLCGWNNSFKSFSFLRVQKCACKYSYGGYFHYLSPVENAWCAAFDDRLSVYNSTILTFFRFFFSISLVLDIEIDTYI